MRIGRRKKELSEAKTKIGPCTHTLMAENLERGDLDRTTRFWKAQPSVANLPVE